jgi:uncharacterized protein (TIGR02594 family)
MDAQTYVLVGAFALNLVVLLVVYLGEKFQQRQITRILEDALARAQGAVPTVSPMTSPPVAVPPANPVVPPPVPVGPFADFPSWFQKGLVEIGFHEIGNNQGIEKYIALAHTGSPGDPWCAIFANAMLEEAGIPGTRSPSSQSFRNNPNFVPLAGPAKGAIVVYWRGSPTSGLGHVGFYRGENASSIWTLGGNENDMVEIAALPKTSATFGFVGYFWPKSVPLPAIGAVTMAPGSPTTVTVPLGNSTPAPAAAAGAVQQNIVATYFGGQQSAYGGPIIDSQPGVALPFRFSGVRPKVRVTGVKSGVSIDCDIVDVGPWNINDPYWETGARPQAESGMDLGQVSNGVPRRTNGAGIDLTLAAATALGIDGKGLVNWQFLQSGPAVA